MRNQYKLLQEAYKRVLENNSDTSVAGIMSKMIDGIDVVAELNKIPSVIAIFHLDYDGVFANTQYYHRTKRRLLPSTAVPISKSAWCDPYQKTPDFNEIFVKVYITNTSNEAIDFVNLWTKDDWTNSKEQERVWGFMKDIYDALDINVTNHIPKLPQKNWLKRLRILKKASDKTGIEMDI